MTDLVVIYFAKNRLGKNRLGITVSKKLGGAVVRNRARRVVKECYRLTEENVKVGYDIVLVVRSKAVGESFGRVWASLKVGLEKSGLARGADGVQK